MGIGQISTVVQLEANEHSANTRGAVLRAQGFVVECAVDAASTLQLVRSGRCDLALVHRDGSKAPAGTELGQQLRLLEPTLGIVMLAPAWDRSEKRHALESFADDCLNEDEVDDVVARLKALRRRARNAEERGSRVQWGPFVVDLLGNCVELDGREVSLQPLQLRILCCLVQRAGSVVSREELRRLVFRVAQGVGSTSIQRQISVLRKELGAAGQLIATAPGGYGVGLARRPQ